MNRYVPNIPLPKIDKIPFIEAEVVKKGIKKEVIKLSIDPTSRIIKQINDVEGNIKPNYQLQITIDLCRADKIGYWSWHECRDWSRSEKYNGIVEQFIQAYSGKTYAEISSEKQHKKNPKKSSSNKHIFYTKKQIQKEASDRLILLALDDFEEIFRFRLTGAFRIFGVFAGNLFLMIWHDPDHKIYND